MHQLKACRAMALLFLTACPRGGVTWVEGGRTEADLTFGIAAHRGGTAGIQFGVFRVEECDGPSTRFPQDTAGLVWLLLDTLPGGHEYPARLRYGDKPYGYHALLGPKPLEPGCYLASSDVGPRARFTVDSSGEIVSQD